MSQQSIMMTSENAYDYEENIFQKLSTETLPTFCVYLYNRT